MNRAETAKKLFEDGFLCAPAVFSVFSEGLGLEKRLALKIACGFGAGICGMGKTCGAVTGALMAIGLKHGKEDLADEESRQKTFALAKEYLDKFRELYGTIECKELIGYDLSNPDELLEARESGVFKTRCTDFVYKSAHLLEEILYPD